MQKQETAKKEQDGLVIPPAIAKLPSSPIVRADVNQNSKLDAVELSGLRDKDLAALLVESLSMASAEDKAKISSPLVELSPSKVARVLVELYGDRNNIDDKRRAVAVELFRDIYAGDKDFAQRILLATAGNNLTSPADYHGSVALSLVRLLKKEEQANILVPAAECLDWEKKFLERVGEVKVLLAEGKEVPMGRNSQSLLPEVSLRTIKDQTDFSDRRVAESDAERNGIISTYKVITPGSEAGLMFDNARIGVVVLKVGDKPVALVGIDRNRDIEEDLDLPLKKLSMNLKPGSEEKISAEIYHGDWRVFPTFRAFSYAANRLLEDRIESKVVVLEKDGKRQTSYFGLRVNTEGVVEFIR